MEKMGRGALSDHCCLVMNDTLPGSNEMGLSAISEAKNKQIKPLQAN